MDNTDHHTTAIAATTVFMGQVCSSFPLIEVKHEIHLKLVIEISASKRHGWFIVYWNPHSVQWLDGGSTDLTTFETPESYHMYLGVTRTQHMHNITVYSL